MSNKLDHTHVCCDCRTTFCIKNEIFRAQRQIGTWECDVILSNDIQGMVVYTFYKDKYRCAKCSLKLLQSYPVT